MNKSKKQNIRSGYNPRPKGCAKPSKPTPSPPKQSTGETIILILRGIL